MKLSLRLLLLISLTFIFSSCRKDKTSTYANIIGKWKWLSTYKDIQLGPDNPLTPANTGDEEFLIFNTNHTWTKILNTVIVDSGTFTSGHGIFVPYPGAGIFVYDSLKYYHGDNPVIDFGGVDYFKVVNDTLFFLPYFGGRLSSYTLHSGGAKEWKKQ